MIGHVRPESPVTMLRNTHLQAFGTWVMVIIQELRRFPGLLVSVMLLGSSVAIVPGELLNGCKSCDQVFAGSMLHHHDLNRKSGFRLHC